jgi:DNA-directed RNA polymerase specialized sigma24 family protein
VVFLESVVKKLPESYQEALMLRLAGNEVDESAEILQLHKLAFKSRYHRAQKMARQIAGEEKYSA